MHARFRIPVIFAIIVVMDLRVSVVAAAQQPRYVADPVTNEECGACHMPFSPRFLPKRSWKRILSNLENHFGTDASLDPDTRDHIAAFYARYGAERGDDVLRITDTWWWVRAHRYEIPESVWIKLDSPANCLACHGSRKRGAGNE